MSERPDRPEALPAGRLSEALASWSPASRGRALAIFGSARRKGEWEPPDRLQAQAFCGSVSLDFRQAILPGGVTEVDATAVLGNVELIVPPDLEVEVDTGFSLFGSVQQTRSAGVGEKLRQFLLGPRDDDHGRDDEPPILYVRAQVLFGSVHVRVKT
jgi:hypothetical protein